MAYDANLAEGIDALIKKRNNFTRNEMFGGVGFLLDICAGVHSNDLIFRFNPKETIALKKDHVRPLDITGRPMKGWLLVSGEPSGKELKEWFEIALHFVETLPPKK